MVIYSKTGIKNKKIIARIYIRDKCVIVWGGKEYNYYNSIVLRLFFTGIDKHRVYIEQAPSHIKSTFIDDNGICHHDRENCHFRKSYTIDGEIIEKCGGNVFEYYDPKTSDIKDYMNILKEFYGGKNKSIFKSKKTSHNRTVYASPQ